MSSTGYREYRSGKTFVVKTVLYNKGKTAHKGLRGLDFSILQRSRDFRGLGFIFMVPSESSIG